MLSHVALLVAITSVKNNHLFSYGLAKYKISKEITQTIRWKYFFPTNEQPQFFTPGDLVFILGKYMIENLEQCITISYASIVNNDSPNCEFDVSNIPVCMISVIVNRKLKEVKNYVHFRVESVEYNSVTSLSDVKMQMTVLYSSQATRFQKYLGIQARVLTTDINYLRTSTLNYNTFENSSLINSKSRSIIDIIANDIESVSAQIPLKHAESSAYSDKLGNISAFESTETLFDASIKTDNKNDGPDFEDENELDDDTCIEDEEYEEDL
ncbi:7894_t:CDS:2 [Gigaspora margarita]|uniref:7894_t:CDS:1 n=1 Tax=Gigaspora margarita TaxID=4874 RepID=A0ABN7VI13_GIGMA|nr:7894_t:CDS:2 [Gigaspora margarita]